jgi:hypothetical protein
MGPADSGHSQVWTLTAEVLVFANRGQIPGVATPRPNLGDIDESVPPRPSAGAGYL